MGRIKQVVPKEDYSLLVVLENGKTVILNMKNKLHTIRFGLLEDKIFFDKETTDGSFILWEDRVQISINEVLQLALS